MTYIPVISFPECIPRNSGANLNDNDKKNIINSHSNGGCGRCGLLNARVCGAETGHKHRPTDKVFCLKAQHNRG